MTELEEFKIYYADLEHSTLYQSWAAGHPADAKAWDGYAQALIAGHNPEPPTVTTGFAKSLLDVGAMAVIGTPVDPPPIPPPPVSSDAYDALVSALVPPKFEYTKQVPVTTLKDYLAMVANPQPGYWYDVQSVSVPGRVDARHALSAWCKFTYDAGCKFTGSAVGSDPIPVMEVTGAAFQQHIWAEGCIMTNRGGNGIHSQGATHHCVFDGAMAQDMGADGYALFGGAYGPGHDNFMRLRAKNIALESAKFDPHAEKGTGLHGMNFQDSNKNPWYNNIIAIHCSDCPGAGGSVLECGVASGGAQPYGNTYYVKGERMLFFAKSQSGGMGINMWGGPQHDNTFAIIEVEDVAGYAMNMGAQGGQLTNVKVLKGKATNACRNPRYAGQDPWMKKAGLIYAAGWQV